MSCDLFAKKDNMQMLWDIVSDEDNFRFLTPEMQSNIYQVFYNNIQGFYETEKHKTKYLVELNKKYLVIIHNHINKTYPNKPNKIKIHGELNNNELINNELTYKSPITYEEIQTTRKTQMDKDYTKRQEDFEDYMKIKPPPVPEFSIKNTDGPIKEMDKILKEMTAQRNYDVEQINRTNNTVISQDKWLKSQNTSLKNEKFILEETKEPPSRFKFLNNITQDSEPKKNVSWSNNDEIQTFNIDDDNDVNIFAKLKRKPKPIGENHDDNNIKFIIEETSSDNKYPYPASFYEDKILQLERTIQVLNDKMDKMINLLSKPA